MAHRVVRYTRSKGDRFSLWRVRLTSTLGLEPPVTKPRHPRHPGMQTHRRNIRRYSRLLSTPLTDLERQYLHRRIAEEQAELERLAQAEH